MLRNKKEFLKNDKPILFTEDLYIKIKRWTRKEFCKEKFKIAIRFYNKNFNFQTFIFIEKNTSEINIEERLDKFLNYVKLNPRVANSIEYFKILHNENFEKKFNEYKNKTLKPFQIEYWIKKGFSENEAILEKKKYYSNKANTLENFIKRYGETEGLDKFKEWTNKCLNNKEKFIQKYGFEIGKFKWEEYLKTKDSSSLKWALKKTNNNYKAALRLKNEKESKSKKTLENNIENFKKTKDFSSINYFIDKYGVKEGAQKHLENNNKKDNSSLNYFINKYNLEKGLKEYIKKSKKSDSKSLYYFYKKNNKNINLAREEYIKIHSSKGTILKASKESLKYFLYIYNELKNKYKIFLGIENNKEYFLNNGINIYFYDFTIPELKIIIEYNGEYFHPNYEKYSIEELKKGHKNINIKKNINKIIEKEYNKINLAKNNGYDLLILWGEDDYKKNINKIINFLKQKNILDENKDYKKEWELAYLGFRGK